MVRDTRRLSELESDTAMAANGYDTVRQQMEAFADAPERDLLAVTFLETFQNDLCVTAGDPRRIARLPDHSALKQLVASVPDGIDLKSVCGKLQGQRASASAARQAIALSRIELALSLCRVMEAVSGQKG